MGRALLVLETPSDRSKAVNWIGKAPVGTRVEFKASKRTLPQNDMLWALLTEVSQQLAHGGTKYDPSQWKAIFLHAFGREVSFLPSLDRKTFLPLELSSSDLSKDEMTDFIEFIMKEAGERGVTFKDHRSHDQSQSGSTLPDPVPAEDVSTSVSAASDDIAPSVSSDVPLSQADMEWLKTVAKKLWSVTSWTGNTEENLWLLNSQRMACNAIDFNPSKDTRDKAGSIYRTCKEVVLTSIYPPDALASIANYAGISEKELIDG